MQDPYQCQGYNANNPCPVDCKSTLLLEEFREFRTDFNAWRLSISERVVSIESAVKTGVTGNGTPSRLAVVEKGIIELKSIGDQRIGQGRFHARMTAAVFTLVLAVIGIGGGVWSTYHKENIDIQNKMSESAKQNTSDRQIIFDALDVLNAEALTAENQRAYLAQALHKNFVVGSMNHKGIGNVQNSVNKLSNDINKPAVKHGWFR